MISHDTPSRTQWQEKWGSVLNEGFQVIPNRLLKSQHDLNLSNAQMVVLLNLLMHWWVSDRNPYPQSNIIANRMGVDLRNVQRALKEMDEMKIIHRVRDAEGNKSYDLTPLVEKLKALSRGGI